MEYVTGGGLAGAPLPAGLLRDGHMMLHALLSDLAVLPGVTTITTRDTRLAAERLPGEVVPVGAGDDPWALWRRLAGRVDGVWPIAPETGGVLLRLTELAVASGRLLFGSRPRAVRVAGSKRATSALLGAPPDRGAGWVAKPDDGAGCERTRRFPDRADAEGWAAAQAGAFVVQPYAPGVATSLSLLCSDGLAGVLACNRQDVSEAEDGTLALHGVETGALEGRRAALTPVADRVARALPDLFGHVGVDLADGPDGPVVLDVNPRLTLAYPSLGAHLGENPAALVLGLPHEA